MYTASIVIFLCGLGFIAVGFFGQIEFWEVKIPASSMISRSASLILGLFLAVASVFTDPPLFNLGARSDHVSTIYITDDLGATAESELLNIYIAEKLVGQIRLDLKKKREFIAVGATGNFEQYRLEGAAIEKSNGKVNEINGAGSGTIDLTKSGVYSVENNAKVGSHAALSLRREI